MNEEKNGIYIAPTENEVDDESKITETAPTIEDAAQTPTPTPQGEGADGCDDDCECEAEEPETEEPQGEAAAKCPTDKFAPSNAHETIIANHLDKMADENPTLRDKILAALKDGYGIAKCYDYIKGEARKKAVSGCAMIEDEVVYGWAVHFYEDEWISVKERDEKDAVERKKREKEAAERAAKWKADQAKRDAERKAEEEKAEAEKLAAMTAEERLAYEREKARKEAEEAERKAEAERIAAEAEKKRLEREDKRKAAEEKKRKAEEAAKAQMTFF